MSKTMLPKPIEFLAERADRYITAKPEYLFRDWGAPTADPMDNVVATLLAVDESTVIDGMFLPSALTAVRLPFRDVGLGEDITRPTLNYITFRPRNYFARDRLDVSVMHDMGLDVSALKVDMTRFQASFFFVWYMPID